MVNVYKFWSFKVQVFFCCCCQAITVMYIFWKTNSLQLFTDALFKNYSDSHAHTIEKLIIFQSIFVRYTNRIRLKSNHIDSVWRCQYITHYDEYLSDIRACLFFRMSVKCQRFFVCWCCFCCYLNLSKNRKFHSDTSKTWVYLIDESAYFFPIQGFCSTFVFEQPIKYLLTQHNGRF